MTTTTSQRRSSLEVGIDRIWRFFCSVRAAIWEISFLALLVLIGTLRGSKAPQWLANGIPSLQPLVDRWYAWDVYRSPLFAATLAIIAVAIAICTINRVPAIWLTISEPRVRTSMGYLTRSDTSATFQTGMTPAQLTETLSSALKRRNYRVLTQEIGTDVHVYADRNRIGKLGTFPFHLALILLMVGGIVATTYGFRETEFVIPVGETRPVGHGTGLSVELVRFVDTYTPQGIAADYKAEIVIYDDGKQVKHETISPNHPTSWRIARFYQTSFGFGAKMRVTDEMGREVYAGTVDTGIFTWGGNPDSPAGFVEIPAAGVTMTVVAPDIDPGKNPELDTLNLKNGQMLVVIQPTGSDVSQREMVVVNQGSPVQIGNLTVDFQREVQWSLLQVAYNPGIPIFVIASVFMLGGLLATFYLPLRRIRAIVAPTPAGSTLVAMPLAKRDWSGKRDFFRTMVFVEEVVGSRPVLKQPAGGADWEIVQRSPTSDA